jgi:hypothetical protein
MTNSTTDGRLASTRPWKPLRQPLKNFRTRPPGDPSVLLDGVEWAKEAGDDEIAERYQAKYDAVFEGGTSQ